MVHNEQRYHQKALQNALHFNTLPIPAYCHSIAKYTEVQPEYGELRQSSLLPKGGTPKQLQTSEDFAEIT